MLQSFEYVKLDGDVYSSGNDVAVRKATADDISDFIKRMQDTLMAYLALQKNRQKERCAATAM